jgi:lipid A 4'-phosphatase
LPFRPDGGRPMSRTGALIAVAIAAVTGLAFGLFPELDIVVSRLFYEPGAGFALQSHQLWTLVRDGIMVVVGAMVGIPLGAVVAKLIRPRTRLAFPGRAVVFLVATVVLAPLVTANVLLKDNWGRPRPREVAAFGGPEQFVPWWDPRGPCRANCSFVAGEASGAFWTIAPAALAPPQWRPLAYGAAIAFGVLAGILRMAFGGHFFSDVVFAGVITFVIIWLAHSALYRWRGGLLSDDAIERALERVAGWARQLLGRGRRKPSDTPRLDVAKDRPR